MNSHSPSRPLGHRAPRLLSAILRPLANRQRYRRAYASLKQIDDHLLRDMGLTRADLEIMRRHW